MNSVPVSVALVAGGLAVLNPCGFPMLPAFLSFYVGAEESRLPRASTRVLQGLLVGGLVSVGFVGFFAILGLPISFGVAAVARAVPWAGLITGALVVAAGVFVFFGRNVTLPFGLNLRVRKERSVGPLLLFGVGYGAASLGCTLPLFLTFVAASSGPDKLGVFVAYGAGITLVLMSLAVVVALAREGIARGVRPLLPHMGRIAGLLLVVAGGYLVYYWARLHFGDTATVADDPIVSFAFRFSGRIRVFAEDHGSTFLLVAGGVVALSVAVALLARRKQSNATGLVSE